VEEVPIATFPSPCITNGVMSGFVLSSTTNAFPVPTCVSLTRSVEVDADAIIRPVTFSILPSNVRLLSTIAFGIEPLRVITPLSVEPVRLSNPEVPEDPDVPDEPVDPLDPDVPLEPEDPEEPDVPDDPALPEEPDDPDDPDVPDEPLDPLVPEEPEEPELPDKPLFKYDM
jgi:hypothetical protein